MTNEAIEETISSCVNIVWKVVITGMLVFLLVGTVRNNHMIYKLRISDIAKQKHQVQLAKKELQDKRFKQLVAELRKNGGIK